MKLFAFAALLALPLLGLGAQGASADYYCCGKGRGEQEAQHYYVVKNSVIFDCDAHHCETKIKVYGGTKIKAECNNGWCSIKDFPFAHMWVLESCLKQIGDDNEQGGEDGGDEGGEGEARQSYKRHHYRRY
jgi:hypothetical protein